jgi:hypothetical protein
VKQFVKRWLAVALCFILVHTSLPQAIYAKVPTPISTEAPLAERWMAEKRIPIRANIENCAVLLAPHDADASDSVGIPLTASHDLEEFSQSIQEAVELKGRDSLVGGHIYVLGVGMSNASAMKLSYQDRLKGLGFSAADIQVHVLSVPEKKLREIVAQAMQGVWEHFRYFMLSGTRDFERPIREELISGFAFATAVEIPHIAYMYSRMPMVDFAVTALTHLAVNAVYITFAATITNWVLRSKSNLESLVKQACLSFPFILNYNVFGHFSEIMHFIQANGIDATLNAFPGTLKTFVALQGFTLFLQTVFYNIVNTRGIGAWRTRQVGPERSRAARAVGPFVKYPFSLADSTFLTMAAATGTLIAQVGPIPFNTGHLGLILLTLGGGILALKPSLLDPTLAVYFKAKGVWSKFLGWFRRDAGVDLEKDAQDIKES